MTHLTEKNESKKIYWNNVKRKIDNGFPQKTKQVTQTRLYVTRESFKTNQ